MVGQSIEKFVHSDDLYTFRDKIKLRKTQGDVMEMGQADNGISKIDHASGLKFYPF